MPGDARGAVQSAHCGTLEGLAPHPTLPWFATAGRDRCLRLSDATTRRLLAWHALAERDCPACRANPRTLGAERCPRCRPAGAAALCVDVSPVPMDAAGRLHVACGTDGADVLIVWSRCLRVEARDVCARSSETSSGGVKK